MTHSVVAAPGAGGRSRLGAATLVKSLADSWRVTSDCVGSYPEPKFRSMAIGWVCRQAAGLIASST